MGAGGLMMRAFASAAVTTLVALVLAAAHAQAPEPFPSKPVHIIVGVGAGGLIDTFIRLLADPLQRQFGQPVIVENKLGSGGTIGARAVAEAKPDGYTLVAASPGTLPAALLHDPPPYTAANFTPVALVLEGGSLIGIRAGTPVKTFADFVTYGKANPGKLNYASSGVGSPTHLSIQYLADLVGIQMTHVPYKGDAIRSIFAVYMNYFNALIL
jgi:tripartite-type tricarboxylate transporter receptor subunit TctC